MDMKNKINNFREVLHRELESDYIDYEKVLEISQELDELIVEYYNNKNKEPVDFFP